MYKHYLAAVPHLYAFLSLERSISSPTSRRISAIVYIIAYKLAIFLIIVTLHYKALAVITDYLNTTNTNYF